MCNEKDKKRSCYDLRGDCSKCISNMSPLEIEELMNSGFSDFHYPRD